MNSRTQDLPNSGLKLIIELEIDNWTWNNGQPVLGHQDYVNHPHKMSTPRNEHKNYNTTIKIDQFFKECSLTMNQAREIPILYALICGN